MTFRVACVPYKTATACKSLLCSVTLNDPTPSTFVFVWVSRAPVGFFLQPVQTTRMPQRPGIKAKHIITFINVPVPYLHADHILIRGVSAAFLPLSHPALLFLSLGLDRSPCRPAIKGHSAPRHKLQSTVSPLPLETHLNNQIIFFCILLFTTDVLQWQRENTFMFQQLQDTAEQRHYFQQALSLKLSMAFKKWGLLQKKSLCEHWFMICGSL